MRAGRSLRALSPRRPGEAPTQAYGERELAYSGKQSGLAETLTIGQVARLTGVNAKTIRYYESVGLLPRPSRSANSYRRYGQADVSRILLLHCLRELGVSGGAVRPLLAQLDDARCAEVRQDLLQLLDERLRALDEEIAALRRLRVGVSDYQRAVAACQPDPEMPFRICVAQTPATPRGVGMLSYATPFDTRCADHTVPFADEDDSSVTAVTASDDLNREERIHASVCCDESCCACCA